jgi:hypothetical protein
VKRFAELYKKNLLTIKGEQHVFDVQPILRLFSEKTFAKIILEEKKH